MAAGQGFRSAVFCARQCRFGLPQPLKTPHASPKEKFLPDPGNDMGNVGVVVEQLLEGCQGQAGSRVLAATLNKPTPESLLKEPKPVIVSQDQGTSGGLAMSRREPASLLLQNLSFPDSQGGIQGALVNGGD